MAAYKNYEEYIARLKCIRTGLDDPKMRVRLDTVLHRQTHSALWLSAGMAAILFLGLTMYLNFSRIERYGAGPFRSYIFQPLETTKQPVFNYLFSD
ncbi:MAG: hypothetical protein WC490_07890 [Candidatus Margulisiibacteriota bacterium]